MFWVFLPLDQLYILYRILSLPRLSFFFLSYTRLSARIQPWENHVTRINRALHFRLWSYVFWRWKPTCRIETFVSIYKTARATIQKPQYEQASSWKTDKCSSVLTQHSCLSVFYGIAPWFLSRSHLKTLCARWVNQAIWILRNRKLGSTMHIVVPGATRYLGSVHPFPTHFIVL
jgi:hypothetical protein